MFFCLVLSLFLSDPFLILAHSPDRFSPKPPFFRRWALLCGSCFVFLIGYEMSTLVGGLYNICCYTALLLAFMHLYSIFICLPSQQFIFFPLLFLFFLYLFEKGLYPKRQLFLYFLDHHFSIKKVLFHSIFNLRLFMPVLCIYIFGSDIKTPASPNFSFFSFCVPP